MGNKLRHKIGWAGADEAGRGPLAGPVVAAAVVLPRGFRSAGIDDSKKLPPSARELAADRIKKKACWAIGMADVYEIDTRNILQASLLAMRRAIEQLQWEFDGVLVDGNQPVRGLDCPVECIIEGDGKFVQIAAASILAKTYRDALMREYANDYPGYGFEHHFGYSTPEHYRALDELGPCALHRKSFAPVREKLQPCLEISV